MSAKRLIVLGLDGGTESVLDLPDANCPALESFKAVAQSGV